MISAKIVADSINSSGNRLTTFVLTYPRFIHAEFMTHRVFSRNASSSRAIPVKKQIQMVIDDPVIPLAFTSNKPGMQGGDPLSEFESSLAEAKWLEGRDAAVEIAKNLEALNLHKQYANRVLEPYAHITVVCTATDYANFFALRCHEAAQPEIRVLAEKMYEELMANSPVLLPPGKWHLPFVNPSDYDTMVDGQYLPESILIKMSVARCARVSYLNHEGKKPTLEEDLKLYERLVGSAPIHASPAEHQAQVPFALDTYPLSNLKGWLQYRKTLKDENIKAFYRW